MRRTTLPRRQTANHNGNGSSQWARTSAFRCNQAIKSNDNVHTIHTDPRARARDRSVKLAFHDADTDILARILADTSDARDFMNLFLWQAEQHADIIARMSARMSVSVSWNASLNGPRTR